MVLTRTSRVPKAELHTELAQGPGGSQDGAGLGGDGDEVQAPTLPFPSCVTLGR